jgi:tetratricopeptide (TPR) repeat protein
LAYADKAWLRGDAASIRRAHEKLQAVLSQAPNDAAVAAQLAYTDDLGGDTANAEALYRVALKADPENLIALTNLAAHLAQQGQLSKAIDLWRKALVINPGLPIPGLNLARAEDAQGHRREALEILSQVLSLNPDSQEAFDLRRKLVP